MICLGVQAYDFSVDGLFYRIIDQANKKVAVTQGDSKAIGSITIPETVNYCGLIYEVTQIDRYAFYSCSDLEKITFGSKVETIGESAFGYCKNLSSVLINENLVTIGESAFEYCSSLTSFTVGSKVRFLSKWAFRECENLENVKFNEGLTTIGDEAFNGCKILTNVSIPNSVLEMGDILFGVANRCLT